MWDTYKNTNNYIFQFKIFTCYKLGYLKDSNAAAHSVRTGIS